MIHVVTQETVLSRAALSLSSVPRPLLWRGMAVAPRRGLFTRLFWRVMFEQSLPRYLIALVPFPIAMALRPDLALPIAQAPLFMFALVYLVEAHVLSVSTPEKRRALIDEDAAARGLDRFRLRAERLLAGIAAGRGMGQEVLHLVVEQSPLARIAPLTFVSVQVEGARPEVLDLSPQERETVARELFEDGIDERTLHTINLSQNVFLRDVPLEARAISAHARLNALAAGRAALPRAAL